MISGQKLFLGGTAVGLFSWAATAMAVPMSCPRGGVMERIVHDAVGDGRLQRVGYGYAVIDAGSGRTKCEDYYEEHRGVYPASTIKTLVAIAVLRQVDCGIIQLDQKVVIDQPSADLDNQDRADYRRGQVHTVIDLLADMQIYSNNIATNQLIDLVGKPYINATADALGAPTLRVYRKVYTDVPAEPDNPRRNEATVRGYIELYRELASGALRVLSADSRRLLVGLLAQCHTNNRLGKDFPDSVTFHHKTGSTSDSSSDAGFYFLDNGDAAILVGLQDFRDFPALARAGLALFNLLRSQF